MRKFEVRTLMRLLWLRLWLRRGASLIAGAVSLRLGGSCQQAVSQGVTLLICRAGRSRCRQKHTHTQHTTTRVWRNVECFPGTASDDGCWRGCRRHLKGDPWHRAGRLFQALPEGECWCLPAGARWGTGALGHWGTAHNPALVPLQPRSAAQRSCSGRASELFVELLGLDWRNWSWNWDGNELGRAFIPNHPPPIIHCGGTHCCNSKNSRGGLEGAGPPLIE